MSSGLTEAMKRVAMNTYEASQPTDLRYGQVVGVDPLKVKITNLFTLPESMLVVPEHLTDHEMKVTLKSEYGWKTEDKSGGSGDPAFASHNHEIVQEEKKIFIHGKLEVGDKVALIRKAGGQSYYILDRLPKE